MEYSFIDSVLNLKLDAIATLALASMLLLFGTYLKKKIKFFDKFCIPGPVVGGLIFALVILLLRVLDVVHISMDTAIQTPFMIAFFTTVGLGASFGLLKKGGKVLIIYWALCAILSVFQNAIGGFAAKAMGTNPLIGLMCGAISMEGGHGGAASFGTTIEGLGVNGALTIGMAAATFGLIFGGIIGAPVARYLIEKYNLKSKDDNVEKNDSVVNEIKTSRLTAETLIVQIAVITVCMTVGTKLGALVSDLTGVILPNYVGSLFVAVIFRNINDKLSLVKLDFEAIDMIGDITLGVFLSMALMSIKLWELSGLAGTMVVILVLQVVVITLFGVFVAFKVLGKDFDAAVMVSGMLGHGLGATPNALANIGSVTNKYGYSAKAYLVVPLVGAFLSDVVNIPIIVGFINMFNK